MCLHKKIPPTAFHISGLQKQSPSLPFCGRFRGVRLEVSTKPTKPSYYKVFSCTVTPKMVNNNNNKHTRSAVLCVSQQSLPGALLPTRQLIPLVRLSQLMRVSAPVVVPLFIYYHFQLPGYNLHLVYCYKINDFGRFDYSL